MRAERGVCEMVTREKKREKEGLLTRSRGGKKEGKETLRLLNDPLEKKERAGKEGKGVWEGKRGRKGETGGMFVYRRSYREGTRKRSSVALSRAAKEK